MRKSEGVLLRSQTLLSTFLVLLPLVYIPCLSITRVQRGGMGREEYTEAVEDNGGNSSRWKRRTETII